MDVRQSDKLQHVAYDVRGPLLDEAARMEAEGQRVLKLNIGNPAPFGFDAPDEILQAVTRNLISAQGYSESKGLYSARTAVEQYYQLCGVDGVTVDDIYLGNGVSELIAMTLQALLNNGDEVLIPSPDYPLWTAMTSLSGGTAVHYRCDESADWLPDLDDLEAKVSDRTKAIVIISPNNPTGAVYPRAFIETLVEFARQHDLVIFSDEIYDKILYDDAEHTVVASIAPDVLCLTFSGLSKAYRVAGFRAGWVVVSGPKQHAQSYIAGLTVLANMRLCPNVPAQLAIQTALGGYQSINELVLPGGRLCEQRDVAWRMLNDIPGVSCTKPQGALYVFPRLDPDVYPIVDDERMALDLLRSQQILLTQGTGFNWAQPDHVRIVTLPHAEVLADAIERFGVFLSTYQQ
ncbi:MAG TPA: pyridoxal phosphate-dependent aminotransferase [Mycobacteriales bacterium]|nr:pyridoxal phosphate-dependent aminotransferase [Mycobacteriales bacterium]